jgi:O-antigen ligase/tetratricopeptide (TPR) repeat protein
VAADRWCRSAIEAVVLLMATGAPWALGGTLPEAILALEMGAGLVLILWALRAFLTRSLPFQGDVVLWALGALTLLAAFQQLPISTPTLSVLSPETVATNQYLRPEVRERLPDEPAVRERRASAFPLSLSPPDTREWFLQLFTLTLLYAAVRSNLAGPGFLVRLAWACSVNGALLSALGIAQLSDSKTSLIYWSVPTEGQVFGPFVNRNHFPFYVGPCLGLGCALLADRFREGVGEFLHRPAGLWLAVFVGLMAAGLFFSHSRGGVVAALVASAACFIIWFRHSEQPSGLNWIISGGLIAGAILAWLGWSSVMARLGTLDAGRLSDEARMELWSGGLRTFLNYPLFGTGAGTFLWVEPAQRTRPGFEDLTADHAHNEYIEALVEGGLLRLALTILLVAGPVVAVVRQYRRKVDDPSGPLLLGGLFGIIMLAAESVVDFGVHLPAVAVLSCVSVAGLMGHESRAPTIGERSWVRAPLGAIALLTAGILIAWNGLVVERAEKSRWAARGLSEHESLTPAEAVRAVKLLSAACAAEPENAVYQHELGQAHLAAALGNPANSPERTTELREALRHWRAARDLSPVMAPTHARLGRYRDFFEQADPAIAYLERARQLLPTDAEMAFECGLVRWRSGDLAGACADWRASLAASEKFLPEILKLAGPKLGPEAVLREVLPEQPSVQMHAAELLFPDSERGSPIHRMFLEQARAKLAAKTSGKTAGDWELEARINVALNEPEQASTAYRHALGLSPRRTDWRFAYAQFLQKTGAPTDAQRELKIVLAQQPSNRPAQDLLAVVEREIKLKK